MTYHRTIIIVQAADQGRANAAAQSLSGATPADAFTFTVGLNPSGLPSNPPTHYWASVLLEDAPFATVQQLQAAFTGSTVQEWDLDTTPNFPAQLLASLGLKVIETIK